MLAFPRMPEWDEDEIAGSYFSYLARENAIPSRFAFLRWLGFERNYCNAQVMDISDLTSTWIGLAEKLEIGLDVMIRQLSTKPYWACFYREPRLPESELKILRGLPAELELLLAISHPRLQLRVCTKCLASEYSSARGGAILHRSHQLPGTFYCHKHGMKLIDRCPGCGLPLALRGGFVDVPLICISCGYDLRTHQEQPDARRSAFLKLARFEHECLCSEWNWKPASEVASFIEKTCRERDMRVVELLDAHFGSEINTWRRTGRTTMPERIYLRREGMPTLCACLVALGFTHESAQQALRESKPEPPKTSAVVNGVGSIAQARRIVLSKIRSGERVTWGSLQRGSQHLFWLLVLRDRAWLDKKLGPRLRKELPIPSVEEDRQAMFGSYSDHQRWEAYGRASCRDREWLQEELSRRREQQSRRRTLARDARLRSSLRKAMIEWFGRPGRPAKFTLARAAAATGTGVVNIQSLNRRDPQPRDTLYESTGHYRLRAMMWTMRELAEESALITPKRLLRLSRVAVGPMERFWAASIFYLLGPVSSEGELG